MTPTEKKAREIATDEMGEFWQNNYFAAMEMARWKDEQHEQEKQQWLNKACEWWEIEFDFMSMQYHDSKEFYQSKLDNFKKAMEEENNAPAKASRLCYDRHGNAIINNLL